MTVGWHTRRPTTYVGEPSWSVGILQIDLIFTLGRPGGQALRVGWAAVLEDRGSKPRI